MVRRCIKSGHVSRTQGHLRSQSSMLLTAVSLLQHSIVLKQSPTHRRDVYRRVNFRIIIVQVARLIDHLIARDEFFKLSRFITAL